MNQEMMISSNTIESLIINWRVFNGMGGGGSGEENACDV